MGEHYTALSTGQRFSRATCDQSLLPLIRQDPVDRLGSHVKGVLLYLRAIGKEREIDASTAESAAASVL